VAIEAHLTELHHHKSALEAERAITVYLTGVTGAINCEGTQRPAFTRANQNVDAVAGLLDTLPTPSTDGVDRVYHQLKDILDITEAQQEESSL
jgi:hypothetical protein